MKRDWLKVFDVLAYAKAGTLQSLDSAKVNELQGHIDLLASSARGDVPFLDPDRRLTWRGHELLEDLGPREALEITLKIFEARQVGATEERLRAFLKEKAWQRLEGNLGNDPESCEGPAGPTNEAAPAAESGGSPSREEPTGGPTKAAPPAAGAAPKEAAPAGV